MFPNTAIRFVGALLAAGCLLAACGKPPSRGLPGIWLVDGPSARSLEFKPDGTVQMRVRQVAEGPVARWAVDEPGHLKLTFGNVGRETSQSMSFELKGDDELTLKRANAGANPHAVAHYRRVAFADLKNYAPLPPQGWVYADRKDARTGTLERVASATSGEASDGSTVDLVLRRRGPDSFTIELRTGARPQRFACANACEFGVRFDDDGVIMLKMEAPVGGDTAVVSFEDQASVLARLKTTRRMEIRAAIVDRGVVPYDFAVEGLQLP